ncbi:putative spermidine/putrescine ABC transporter permease protein (plasmid) [Sinorhizobium fredii HH103]|uniref:Spermidine/putrescine ABC transporter permease protein n=1 Tax=Sinorhizobium fredii (strain HH103) TaxID=1117943 RepID=G9AJ89_SINF1|nr:ABC transporter permease [Sinorhizobium fredii]CCF01121.1 putative spermidine/putrescine ABC transporter permease protein [Sinorhizobium fredii HH103]
MALPAYASTGQRLLYVAARVLTGLALAFLVCPVLIVLPLSFTSGSVLTFPLPGISLQWYEDFFSNPLWTGALANSLFIGVISTIIATLAGTLAAIGIHNSDFKLKPLIVGILILPLAVPIVIVAVAAFYFFAQLHLVGSFSSIIIMHVVLSLPFVVVTVLATLQGFDPNMVRAASSLGASPLVAFRTVTLPIILPGVVSGGLFAFVTSFDETVVALFLATPTQRTLPRQIFSGVAESVSPTITVAAVILLLVSVGLMLVLEYLRARAAKMRGLSE